MERHTCLTLTILGLGLLTSDIALSSKPRLLLERVDASQCNTDGTVEVHLIELELEGIVRRRDPAQYRLVLDGKQLRQAPTTATTFGDLGRVLDLVLVIQTDQTYEAAMAQIRSGAHRMVQALPKNSKLTLITFDEKISRRATRTGQAEASRAIAALTPAGVSPDLALTDAVQAGLSVLGQATHDRRRLIVLVANGLNSTLKPDLFRNVGNRARAQGIPIHPVGYSSIDERGPLINLGELAKRSGGSFRWAREASMIPAELVNLSQEITRQGVLAFEVPDGCEAPHSLQVIGGSLRSRVINIDSQGPAPWIRGLALRWTVGITGLVLLLTTVLLISRWVLRSFGSRPP